jgi:hypothetical protein
MDLDDRRLNDLFSALGAHLAEAGVPVCIIVVGGANLAVRGLVDRTTRDVDVIARMEDVDGERRIVRAEPFPPEFIAAVERVARDFGLPPNWLNAVVGRQWQAGFPPGFEEGIRWSSHGALTVGLVSEPTLIALKFFAAIDQGMKSVHWQDLMALRPTEDEIERAVDWVRSQDAGADFQHFVDQAREQLRRDLAQG